jgi:hypothetical protein
MTTIEMVKMFLQKGHREQDEESRTQLRYKKKKCPQQTSVKRTARGRATTLEYKPASDTQHYLTHSNNRLKTLGTGYLNCLYAYKRKSASPVLNVLTQPMMTMMTKTTTQCHISEHRNLH